MPLIIGSLHNIFLLVDGSIFFRSTDQLMEPGYGFYTVCVKITKLDIIKTVSPNGITQISELFHWVITCLNLENSLLWIILGIILRNGTRSNNDFHSIFNSSTRLFLRKSCSQSIKIYCWMQIIVLQADFLVSKHRVSSQASRSPQALCI